MDRRSFIKGLVAAPIVIRTPGILMPVKAAPVPFAYVSGLLVNGTQFMKEIWDMRPASFVAAEPWFDDVASITSYEYTDKNPETNPYISNAEVFSSFNREIGRPLAVFCRRSHMPMIVSAESLASYGVCDGTTYLKEIKTAPQLRYEDWELAAFQKIDELKAESK